MFAVCNIRQCFNSVVTNCIWRMASFHAPMTMESDISSVMQKLNSLQTPYRGAVIPFNSQKKLDLIEETALLYGVTQEHLTSLNIIHIAGTKGKGSVAAFVESMLRHAGYSTGLLTSPHILKVQERIRLNGIPISTKKFCYYFNDLFNFMVANEDKMERLNYLAFLNFLGYVVFINEKVDVAVIEVGIGGRYDYTNIIQHPTVCGITSLGYDHESILGKTIESIAWNKAGIFKSSVPAITVPQKYDAAMQTLISEAKLIGTPLECLQPEQLSHPDLLSKGLDGDHQIENAALAKELVLYWIEQMGHKALDSAVIRKGLRNTCWPGRCQTLIYKNITYFIDGAHTGESFLACAKWFREKTLHSPNLNVLLCGISGDRFTEPLITTMLNHCEFHSAIFCPPSARCSELNDNFRARMSGRSQEERQNCESLRKAYCAQANDKCSVVGSCDEAIQIVHDNYSTNTNVLVTGSLYLVAAVLSIIGS